MQASEVSDDLLTIDELAKKLHIHKVTCRTLYRQKVFPGIKIGHRTLRFEYQAVLSALRQANDPAAATADQVVAAK